MNKKPFFSIMIPVYNVKDYIDECMNSVLNQTFDDYEVVLIDDGSTDGSGEICDRYFSENSEKIVVVHKKNEGLFAARRTGIENARGEFGVFLDSDDYLELDCLESIYGLIMSHPDVQMILYNLTFKYEESGTAATGRLLFQEETAFEYDKKELYQKLISGYSLNNIVTKAIKLEILKNDPNDYSKYYSNSHGEDLIQSLYPITVAEKIVYTGKSLYNYRINAKSMTSEVSFEALKKQNSPNGFYEVMKYMELWNITDEESYSRLYAKRYVRLTTNFWKFFAKLNSKSEKLKMISLFKDYYKELGNTYFLKNKYLSYLRKVTVIFTKCNMLTILNIMSVIKDKKK